MEHQDLRLHVHYNDEAEAYLNGVRSAPLAGFTSGYDMVDIENAARAVLKVGKSTFAAHCRLTGGGEFIDAGIGALPSHHVCEFDAQQHSRRVMGVQSLQQALRRREWAP